MKTINVMSVVIITIGLLFGCGTPPKQHVFDRERLINNNYDLVWTAVVSFFAENSISVKTLEKESGLIMAEPLTFPDEWVDCGSVGFLENKTSPKGIFNVFVRKDDNNRIKVTVNSKFTCEAFTTDTRRAIECNSTGIFETLLLDYIEKNS